MESAKRVAKRGVRFCEGNEKERKERNEKKKERQTGREGNKNSKKNFGTPVIFVGASSSFSALFLSLSLSSFFYFVRAANQREKKRLSGIKTRAYFY